MKFCSKCGCENIDEAQFCRNCGLEFNGQVIKKNTEIIKNQDSSLITKLFYKTDKYSGKLRIARSKTISIIVFIALFLFGMIEGAPGLSFIELLIAAVIFGLLGAVPTFIIGYVVGRIVDRLKN